MWVLIFLISYVAMLIDDNITYSSLKKGKKELSTV